jgi:4-hydroxy-tetrahydrodipicolinate synthase
MIAALKQAIAIYTDDPEWTRVRPPLVELTPEQARMLAADLSAISFEMELKRKNTLRRGRGG